ncbi:MAG: peroxidase-related enzyme [Planctomycetaceae bacterium]|nr:peroxidase-related enzyme [Planctomycetaceae bacterium]
MPFVQWIEEDDASGEVAEGYEVYFRKRPDRTKVADIIKCFSHRPDFMKQVMDFSWKLHFCDGHLTERTKELIATLVSGQNRCPYCMHSHAYFLHTHGAEDDVVEAIGRGEVESASVTDAERILLRFTHKLTHESAKNTPDDVQKLRDAGWSEPQIAETIYITALFAFFNRVANGFGLDDPKFFELNGEPNPLQDFLPRVGRGGKSS